MRLTVTELLLSISRSRLGNPESTRHTQTVRFPATSGVKADSEIVASASQQIALQASASHMALATSARLSDKSSLAMSAFGGKADTTVGSRRGSY
jgi:hypothetical protein